MSLKAKSDEPLCEMATSVVLHFADCAMLCAVRVHAGHQEIPQRLEPYHHLRPVQKGMRPRAPAD